MSNLFKNPKFKIFLQWLVMVILVGILAYALWGLTTDLAGLGGAGLHPMRHYNRDTAPSQKIQGWMTFRYINSVFLLPPQYLKENLRITDSHYPNLSIGALAKEQKTTLSAELLLTEQAIKSHAITGGAAIP